ncbi:MAG: hypothetical protein K2G37_05335 [Clostridia bacterium]|nr:hypothetical protein [Clostridia bacterium]MDE7328606.1 hypothetical protein [Clostridia bacterium]
MILSDTLAQPYALLIFSILGITFGALYALNWFVCAFLVKKAIYRHVTQVLYVLLYGASLFLCTLFKFGYYMRVYYLYIAIFATAATSILIYIPIRKYRRIITEKCTAFMHKLSNSKLAQKIKK